MFEIVHTGPSLIRHSSWGPMTEFRWCRVHHCSPATEVAVASASSILAILSICLLFHSAWLALLTDWEVCWVAVGGAKLVENLECTQIAHACTMSDIHSISINIWNPAVQSLTAPFLPCLCYSESSSILLILLVSTAPSLRQGVLSDSFNCKVEISESVIIHGCKMLSKTQLG